MGLFAHFGLLKTKNLEYVARHLDMDIFFEKILHPVEFLALHVKNAVLKSVHRLFFDVTGTKNLNKGKRLKLLAFIIVLYFFDLSWDINYILSHS